MNNFNILISNEHLEVKSDEPMNVIDLTNIFGNVLVACVRQLEIPEEHLAAVRGEMFDDMNLIFSRTLEEAFPELELRPGITEEAILEMENNIIMRRAAELEEETIPVECVIDDNLVQPSLAE